MLYEDMIFSIGLFLLIFVALLETHVWSRGRKGRGGARPA